MAAAGGGRINKPKGALCKKNARGERRLKIKALKRRFVSHFRSNSTLLQTTRNILRQCRTNPKANVHLSGKKRRTLMKEAKRLMRIREGAKEKMKCTHGRGGEETEQNSQSRMETA